MSKKSNRLPTALLETAKDMPDGAILTASDYEKITMRHLTKTVHLKFEFLKADKDPGNIEVKESFLILECEDFIGLEDDFGIEQ